MADIRLLRDQFVNNKFTIDYGVNKRATFINVDEKFAGENSLGHVFRINIFTETFDNSGVKISADFSTSVIGIGDMIAGVFPVDENDVELLGQLLNFDNMERCVVRLYE